MYSPPPKKKILMQNQAFLPIGLTWIYWHFPGRTVQYLTHENCNNLCTSRDGWWHIPKHFIHHSDTSLHEHTAMATLQVKMRNRLPPATRQNITVMSESKQQGWLEHPLISELEKYRNTSMNIKPNYNISNLVRLGGNMDDCKHGWSS